MIPRTPLAFGRSRVIGTLDILSVSHFVDSGFTFHFAPSGAYMMSPDLKRVDLQRDDTTSMWYLDAVIDPEAERYRSLSPR